MTSRAASARRLEPALPGSEGLRRHRDPKDGLWHVHITQGEAYVTADSEEVLTTILGSCVAACIRDSETGIGGMNHFLLPEGGGADRLAMRYGVNAMELLINGILKKGGSRTQLEAKVFGGANVIASMADVGRRNAEFARRFLADEGIPIVGGQLGGSAARRVQFWPQSGRARQMTVTTLDQRLIEAELSQARAQVPSSADEGSDVELF